MISLDFKALVSERIPARKAEKVRKGHVNIISIMQLLTGTPKNYSVKVFYVIIDRNNASWDTPQHTLLTTIHTSLHFFVGICFSISRNQISYFASKYIYIRGIRWIRALYADHKLYYRWPGGAHRLSATQSLYNLPYGPYVLAGLKVSLFASVKLMKTEIYQTLNCHVRYNESFLTFDN